MDLKSSALGDENPVFGKNIPAFRDNQTVFAGEKTESFFGAFRSGDNIRMLAVLAIQTMQSDQALFFK